jgi:hypothetical protein
MFREGFFDVDLSLAEAGACEHDVVDSTHSFKILKGKNTIYAYLSINPYHSFFSSKHSLL